MPSLPDAWQLANGKISVPAELRTAEWAMLPQWLRERAFYMSAVARAEILDEFRGEVEAIARGGTSIPEAEKRLGAFLEKSGYQPLPGQEGTIKDLRAWRRMRTALRTNVELLQGWGQKQRGMTRAAMMAFPAWDLVRIMPRSMPRDWAARWNLSGGKLYGGRRIAMKDSMVWLELSSFADGLGVDYPPFAWGSGMGWKAVPYAEAQALGVIPEGWTPPPRVPADSPNASFQCQPKITSKALRKELARRLQGLAEWHADTLVFTDPNGSRPFTAERLADVWSRPLPDIFADLPGAGQMQREAFLDFVADSSRFHNDPAAGEMKQGRLNWWEDFQRVLARLLPSGRERGGLWRGLTWNTNEQFSGFMAALRRDGYAAREESPAESWAASEQGANKYLAQGKYQVLLRLPAGHSAGRDIAPLVRAFKAALLAREVPAGKLAVTDDEVILPSGAGLRGKRIGPLQETRSGKLIEIELEESP
jgi:hypothetical protein